MKRFRPNEKSSIGQIPPRNRGGLFSNLRVNKRVRKGDNGATEQKQNQNPIHAAVDKLRSQVHVANVVSGSGAGKASTLSKLLNIIRSPLTPISSGSEDNQVQGSGLPNDKITTPSSAVRRLEHLVHNRKLKRKIPTLKPRTVQPKILDFPLAVRQKALKWSAAQTYQDLAKSLSHDTTNDEQYFEQVYGGNIVSDTKRNINHFVIMTANMLSKQVAYDLENSPQLQKLLAKALNNYVRHYLRFGEEPVGSGLTAMKSKCVRSLCDCHTAHGGGVWRDIWHGIKTVGNEVIQGTKNAVNWAVKHPDTIIKAATLASQVIPLLL